MYDGAAGCVEGVEEAAAGVSGGRSALILASVACFALISGFGTVDFEGRDEVEAGVTVGLAREAGLGVEGT